MIKVTGNRFLNGVFHGWIIILCCPSLPSSIDALHNSDFPFPVAQKRGLGCIVFLNGGRNKEKSKKGVRAFWLVEKNARCKREKNML